MLIEEKEADVIIMATGSEVELAIQAHGKLAVDGIKAKVVSMPSCELFEKQSDEYKQSVLTPQIKSRVAVEAGIRSGWDYYLGEKGQFVGMKGFGASAPADKLFDKFQITVEAVVSAVKKSLD